VRARYAALCTELKPFPAAFPGNGSWNAGNVPASTARIWVLAAASPSISPVCTDTQAQRSGRPRVSRFQSSRQIRPAWIATAAGDRDIRESATHSAGENVVSVFG
jgi:hypothetical protein